jgi:RNA polymerase sigma-70 factor (ECF subfamily)
MVLARAGAREAFAALVARHMGRLSGFCARMTGDPGRAEELAQETWLQVWSARGSYRAEGKFTVFLYTAARNRCRNLACDSKRRVRWVVPDGGPGLAAAAESPEQLDEILAQERRRTVNEALAALPEKLREALVLRFSQGLEYEDMALLLGTAESTLRSRVHHGLKRLRASLERGKGR